MTSVRARRALLLVSASAVFMVGVVFLVNVPRYGAAGALAGAVLALLGVGAAAAAFGATDGGGEADGRGRGARQ